jgi:hypothetical protein
MYSQFYLEVKAPFDAAKVYPFKNTGYKSLAIDPTFIETVAYAGGAVVFDKKTYKRGYLNGKNRADKGSYDALYKSYGTREEHRISFKLFNAIRARLVEQSQQEEEQEEELTNRDYYYAIPSKTFFGFLRSQINKFCLGFEHLYSRTAVGAEVGSRTAVGAEVGSRTAVGVEVEWDKSQLMVYFLQMLRLCYGAHQLGRERALYKDKWDVEDDDGNVVQEKEGLGLQDTIRDCGIGWFLPKINWAEWTIRDEYAPKLVFDAPRIRQAYQRRWQAVKGVYDAFSIIRDARKWARRFDIPTVRANKQQWLYYLFAVNLEQFRRCVLDAAKASILLEY